MRAIQLAARLRPTPRHSRESGNPGPQAWSLALDARFRGHDDQGRRPEHDRLIVDTVGALRGPAAG